MARLEPLPLSEIDDPTNYLEAVEKLMGFVPNSFYTMARVPGLLPGFHKMATAVFANQLVPMDLKQMVAHMSSAAAGCRYCQAHTGHNAGRAGASEEKLRALWDFETSELFTDAERAALRVAFAGGQVPNAVTDEQMADLREHWSDDQAAAIVSVIAMFGFLNRWNDTLATTLEEPAIHFGETTLAHRGWEIGKHAG